MSSRKCLSGSEKRKRKKLKDEKVESQKGSLDNYFRTNSSSGNSLQLAIVSVEEQQTENLNEDYVTNEVDDQHENLDEHEEEFSYLPDAENGPAHWGEIKEEWSACGEGEMQSPIDLSNPRVSLVHRLGYLNHSYTPARASIVNRGHDIMMRFDGDAGSVTINGTAYYLRQLHWHSPTEHSVNGRRYDMELHMVHESAQNKAAVIAILYQIGSRDPFLHKLEPYLRMIADQRDREEKVGMVDPRGVRGRASVYYRYLGSLTAPPCTEGIIWTIVKRVRTVSRHQLELLREAVHDDMEKNARPRQDLNNRDVTMFRPYQQDKH